MFLCMVKIISNIPTSTCRGRVLQTFTVLAIIQLMTKMLFCSRNGIVFKKELLSLIIRENSYLVPQVLITFGGVLILISIVNFLPLIWAGQILKKRIMLFMLL